MKRIAFGVIALASLSVSLIAFQKAAPTSKMIDAEQLLLDLKTLSADDMQGREVGTPGNDKARAYIVEQFKASGLKPFGGSYESPFTFTGKGGSGERRGVNVLGWIPGTAAFPKYMIVSAHYDHVGAKDGEVFNGADDNASGTAALFAIAKYFAEHKPQNPIAFAAFDAEEVGLQGSRAYVARPSIDPALLVINLNMD